MIGAGDDDGGAGDDGNDDGGKKKHVPRQAQAAPRQAKFQAATSRPSQPQPQAGPGQPSQSQAQAAREAQAAPCKPRQGKLGTAQAGSRLLLGKHS